jgi:nucleoside-diphosphate-sugar epimerase
MNLGDSSKIAVLVTGATGFVGRPLCEKLLTTFGLVRGAVWIAEPATDLSAGVQPSPIEAIGPNTYWSEALSGIDTVVHLAARVHVMDDTTEDPLEAYREVNVTGTETLARQAVACGVKRLVFISTVKVHGEETDVPYTEEDALAPEDPYGVSKQEAEDMLRQIAVETGLEVVIIRPPLVYGPGVKANFLRLIGIIQRGIPLPLACLHNRRSLIGLGNLVDAIINCATHPRATGNSYLVSDGEDVSTPELIRMIATAFGRPSRLFPVPLPLMRLAGTLTGKRAAVDRLAGSLTVDTTKIRRELGWQPPYTMAQELAETAEWFRTL